MSHPTFSIIIYTQTDFSAIRLVIYFLTKQTIANELEIIIVSPQIKQLDLKPEDEAMLTVFHSVHYVESPMDNLYYGQSIALNVARAPYITFAENHAFPTEYWAESLLELLRNGGGVVGPYIGNANPTTRISRVHFLFGYHHSSDLCPDNELTPPVHQSAYPKSLIQQHYMDDLPEWIRDRAKLHRDIERRGMPIVVTKEAFMWHINPSDYRDLFPRYFYESRIFGGVRSIDWSIGRRFAYEIGLPLIVLMRLRNAWRIACCTQNQAYDFQTLFLYLLALSIVGAIGEVAGLIRGVNNDALKAKEKYHVDPIPWLLDREKHQLDNLDVTFPIR